jgi:hypothetical protein
LICFPSFKNTWFLAMFPFLQFWHVSPPSIFDMYFSFKNHWQTHGFMSMVIQTPRKTHGFMNMVIQTPRKTHGFVSMVMQTPRKTYGFLTSRGSGIMA